MSALNRRQRRHPSPERVAALEAERDKLAALLAAAGENMQRANDVAAELRKHADAQEERAKRAEREGDELSALLAQSTATYAEQNAKIGRLARIRDVLRQTGGRLAAIDDSGAGVLLEAADMLDEALGDRPATVLAEIATERAAQDAKWGEQNHPDVDQVLMTRHDGCTAQRMAEEYGIPTADRARQICQANASLGMVTWAHILIEEVAEAIEAATVVNPTALRGELVQTAAVAVNWIEAIDRRRAGKQEQA